MTAPLPFRALLIAFAVVTAIPTAGTAQTDGPLVDEIQRNSELLMRATELVNQTNSVKARAALEVARKLHQSSLSLLETGYRNMAGRSAREAREAILRAIAIARQEVKLEEGASRAMERARHRLEQANSALDEHAGDDPAARKLVEEARTQLERSHDNMQEHMFETALRLANASAELSGRALQMLRRDGVTPDRLLRELNRTREVLERIDEKTLPPQATSLLSEARALQKRANDNARAKRPRIALEQTRRARAIALRILRSTGPGEPGGRESVERALRFTDDVIERARVALTGNKEKAAQERIAASRELQESARAQLARGELEAAMASTVRAREMATEAIRSFDRPVDRAGVRSTLQKTDEALRALREELAGGDSPRARALLERAERRQREAREAFENGRLRQALAFTKVAMNLVGNARRLLEGAAPEGAPGGADD